MELICRISKMIQAICARLCNVAKTAVDENGVNEIWGGAENAPHVP